MLEESQFINISQKHLLFPNSPFQIAKLTPNNEYELPFDPQPLQMMFDYPQSEQVSPHIKKPSKFLNQQFTTPQKQYPQRRYLSERVEKKTYNTEQQSQPMRSQKGLRHLSIKVKEIVLELRSTSYKDVAERLIQELSKEEGRYLDFDNSKDEQNIKRRVYDALNVMIASKVLRKDGKKVKSDIYSEMQGHKKQFDRDVFRDRLIRKARLVQAKRNYLGEMIQKCKAANYLVDRNKSYSERDSSQIFEFPVVVCLTERHSVKFIRDKKTLKVQAKKKIKVLSDLDIVKQIFPQTVDSNQIIEECQLLI